MDVFLLDKNYQFLQFVSIKRAIKLIVKERVEIIKIAKNEVIRTCSNVFPVPTVIKLVDVINLKIKAVQFTKNRVIKRDNHACQYCGHTGIRMTVDHIIPQSKGGISSWENCVAACEPCNKFKGDRTPQEAGMRLLSKPKQPGFFHFRMKSAKLEKHKNYKDFEEFLYQ